MPQRRRRRRRRWWSPAWLWKHRSRRRRRKVWHQATAGRPSRRPLILGAGVVVFLALALAAALGWHDLRGARSQLILSRDTLAGAIDNPATLRTPEGRAAARAQVDAAVGAVADARRRVTGSLVLSAAGVVPGFSHQRSGLLSLIDDSGAAAGAGRDLLAQVDALAAQTQLRNATVPLDGIAQIGVDARAAAATVGRLARPGSGLWGPLGDARRRFDDLARSSASRLNEGADALDAARGFMGATGGRRYLVALENNAEMRDQGAVLAFVAIGFDGGRLTFGRSGSVKEIALDRAVATPLPPGTEQVFGPILPTRLWQSVNATADFSLSGRTMAAMYQQATGQVVDGVVGIDIPGLAALLAVIGPVQVPTLLEPVTGDNVARILGHDIYEGLTPSTDPLREERYAELTRAVVDRLSAGTNDAVALGRQLGDAAQGGHLHLWSKTDNEEQVFERTGLGGGPATKSDDRTFHLAVENRGATKLDYYVKPSVRQEIELTPKGTAIVRSTVVVANQAPVGAPPSYQLGPDGVTQKATGDYLAWLLLWGPKGSVQAGSVSESGLELSQHVIEVDAGQSRELTFETVIPGAVRDGRLALRLVPQARFEPMDLSVHLKAPGWSVSGPATWRGPWDRTLGLSWRVSR
ncbi:MAG: DUF4012 domain-containing protein [Acidimicrobiales bacterium]